jgi:hypothetical protein
LRERIEDTPPLESVLIAQAMPLVNDSLNGMRTDLRNSTGDVLQIKDLVVTLTQSVLKNSDELDANFRELRYDLVQGLADMGHNLTRGQGGLITGDPNGGVSAEEMSEGSTARGSTAAEGSSEGIPTGPTSEEASPAAGSSGVRKFLLQLFQTLMRYQNTR